jgi:hypothetical protein
MRPVTFDEVVPLERYAALRDAYREAVIAHKRDRRLAVGERVTLVFEDRETLRFQIQEMLWIERISDEHKVQDEIDVYNELVPGDRELSATLFIEITDMPSIRRELDRLVGLDEHVSLLLGEGPGELCFRADFDPRQAEADRISAVQYIRFRLDEAGAARLADFAAPARVRIDHPHYSCEAALPEPLRRSLCQTLAGGPPSLMPEGAGAPPPDRAGDLLFETDRVRALRQTSERAGLHVVVEPRAAVPLLEADAQLLAEVLAAVKRAAASVLRDQPRCRIWTEVDRQGGVMRWHVHAAER